MNASNPLWDVDLYDDRSWFEQMCLIYPRTWTDFDDAEALGLFVPRWHHGIYAVLWAVALTWMRHGFDQYVGVCLMICTVETKIDLIKTNKQNKINLHANADHHPAPHRSL